MSLVRAGLLAAAVVFFCGETMAADDAAISARRASGLPMPQTGAKISPQLQFMAAMQRIRQHLPDETDSPELQAYVIYEYLQAARLERDLQSRPGQDVDAAVD